jgi:hypothetical protein
MAAVCILLITISSEPTFHRYVGGLNRHHFVEFETSLRTKCWLNNPESLLPLSPPVYIFLSWRQWNGSLLTGLHLRHLLECECVCVCVCEWEREDESCLLYIWGPSTSNPVSLSLSHTHSLWRYSGEFFYSSANAFYNSIELVFLALYWRVCAYVRPLGLIMSPTSISSGYFPGDKFAGMWSWPLTSFSYIGQEFMAPYFHSPSTSS